MARQFKHSFRLFYFPLFLSVSCLATAADTVPPVPAEYQSLYDSMQRSITAFDESILAQWDRSKRPVAFSAHTGSANSASGEKLLQADRLYGVSLELDGIKAAGATSMSLSIDYPTLDPAFDPYGGHAAAYLAFYKNVVAAARARGLKVIIETGPLFSDPTCSNVNVMPFYQTLSTASYNAGRANHALLIAQELSPDYLSVIQEPDTEATQTGKVELGTPAGSTALLAQILSTYRNGGQTIPIGAGVGTWIQGWSDYIQRFTATSVDFIDIHIYPSNRDFLARSLTMADMAKAAGKKVGVSECWLNKVRDSELGALPPDAVFARDLYSFWMPLDSLFLRAVTDLAYYKNFDFLAVFRGDVLRGNVDYTAETATLSPAALSALAIPVQSANIQAGIFTATALQWQSLVLPSPDTAAPASPALTTPIVGINSVKLRWAAADDNIGTAGYRVARDGKDVGQTAMLSFTDSGLQDGVKYSFTVTAFDVAGNLSAPASLVVQTRDATPPSTPANVTVTNNPPTQLAVKWAPSTDNVKVDSYQVSRSVDGGVMTMAAKVTSPATSWTLMNAESATSYCFTVVAVDSSNLSSPPSAPVCIKTPDTTAPTVPTAVTAQSGPGQVTVSWNASTDKAGVTVYQVYRGVNGGAMNLLPTPPATPGYIDTSVAAKTTYSYRVAACDGAGNCSAQSSPASVTTGAGLDTTAPVVSISGPSSGTRIGGTLRVTASASDPVRAGESSSGVAGVRFQIDGQDLAREVTGAPYAVAYDTRLLSNGLHVLSAVVRDGAGNTGKSERRWVLVGN